MLAEAAYKRLQFWRKRYGAWVRLICFVVIVDNGNMLVRTLNNPGISVHRAIILAAVLGAVVSASLFLAIYLSIRSKRDEKLVRFFENRFPDECSWKQEERILAEAEEIRLKTSAGLLIHKGIR